MRPPAAADAPRRVLTRAEAIALADAAIGMVTVPTVGVQVSHRAAAVASVTNNHQPHCDDIDELALNFVTRLGSDIPVIVGTNVRDAATLRQMIRNAEMKKTPPVRKEDQEDETDPDLPIKHALGPKQYLPVTLWHDSTTHAMETARGETLARMINVMHDAGAGARDLVMAGTVALTSRVRLCHYIHGMSAWGEGTDSEVTVSVRSQDGRASGWRGQAARDWTQMQPEQVVRDAVTMANKMRGAVRLEPGRYTAILGAAAVGQLVHMMADLFLARANRGGAGPFGLANSPDGHLLRLGQRVFDERITMYTDPNDPMGGDFPFFEEDGTPSGAQTWIEHGVLRALAYDPSDAMEYGKTPIKQPISMHVTGAGKLSTIEEMISTCERGVYVNRFSNVQLVDFKSGAMSGNTRDGCFFIKDGKIHSPVTNFRFFESPFIAFNKVLAVGTPERIAFGFTPPTDTSFGAKGFAGALETWPNPPVIVPPCMFRDFNFSALSDAV